MRTISLFLPTLADYEQSQQNRDFSTAMWKQVNDSWKNEKGFVDLSLCVSIIKQAVGQLSNAVNSPFNTFRAKRDPVFNKVWESLVIDIETIKSTTNDISSYNKDLKASVGSLPEFFNAIQKKVGTKFENGMLPADQINKQREEPRDFAAEQPESMESAIAKMIQNALDAQRAAQDDKKAEDQEARLARIEEMLSNVSLRTGRSKKTA